MHLGQILRLGGSVWFESREISPGAEPVLAAELRAGEVYFAVNFGDERLLIPFVEPRVFMGRNLNEGDTDPLYFQGFESYAVGVRYKPNADNDPAAFHVRGAEDLKHIFEFEKALDRVLACSLRRRGVREF
jgi:hypothetical protein